VLVLVLASGCAGTAGPSRPVTLEVAAFGDCPALYACTWTHSAAGDELVVHGLRLQAADNRHLVVRAPLALFVLDGFDLVGFTDALEVLPSVGNATVVLQHGHVVAPASPVPQPGGLTAIQVTGAGRLEVADVSVHGYTTALAANVSGDAAIHGLRVDAGLVGLSVVARGTLGVSGLDAGSFNPAEPALAATFTGRDVRLEDSRIDLHGALAAIGFLARASTLAVRNLTVQGGMMGGVIASFDADVEGSRFEDVSENRGIPPVALEVLAGGNPLASNRVHGCSFASDPGYGLLSDWPLEASGNWWGDATGPSVAATPTTPRVGGHGSAVNGEVRFAPWLTAAPDASLSGA